MATNRAVSPRRLGLLTLALTLVAAACNDTGDPSGPGSTAAGLAASVKAAARPIGDAATDYDPLLALTGNARVVLLGEATHGTHEFYRERARISRELITRQGFAAVMIEGEWVDAYRVNRYIRGQGTDTNARQALSGFEQFPLWMWRNTDVVELVEWLRSYNRSRPASAQVSFYGFDVYGFYQAIDEVVRYLDRVDPAAASRARERYACFSRFPDQESYGRNAGRTNPSCEQEAAAQLEEMQRRQTAATLADEELFAAVQSARVAKNGERYFRSAFSGVGGSSWNIRDRHMAEVVEASTAHLQARGSSGRVVGWAHNSHVGNASATQMGEGGEINIGQLMRERFADAAVLVGFTTYSGTVIASSEWGAPGERKNVRPAHPESYEGIFHQTGVPNFLLVLRGSTVASELRDPRLERAIGVIYRPESEMASHYFRARLADQFDAVVHFDVTRAVTPF